MVRKMTKFLSGWSLYIFLKWEIVNLPLPPNLPRDVAFGFPHKSLWEHSGKPCSKAFIENTLYFPWIFTKANILILDYGKVYAFHESPE